MSKHLKFTSIDRVISKFVRDSGIEEFSETDIIEQVGEALEQIGCVQLEEQVVEFAKVINHQVALPCNFISLIQIAKDNGANSDIQQSRADPKWSTSEDTSDVFDCSTLLLPTEQTYYSPNFDLKGEYDGYSAETFYNRFVPVRKATHTFFNTVGLGAELYDSFGTSEYGIVHDRIKFSFKEGNVAIAFNRARLDENGYPLIPDEVSVLAAVNAYLMWKYATRLWFLGREGYADKMQYAELQWHWYCKQAGNAIRAPYGEDDFENILHNHVSMIPRNHYYGYFGNLGKDTTVGWSKGIGQGGLGIGRYGNSNYR